MSNKTTLISKEIEDELDVDNLFGENTTQSISSKDEVFSNLFVKLLTEDKSFTCLLYEINVEVDVNNTNGVFTELTFAPRTSDMAEIMSNLNKITKVVVMSTREHICSYNFITVKSLNIKNNSGVFVISVR